MDMMGWDGLGWDGISRQQVAYNRHEAQAPAGLGRSAWVAAWVCQGALVVG